MSLLLVTYPLVFDQDQTDNIEASYLITRLIVYNFPYIELEKNYGSKKKHTTWKVSKYGVFSGAYFPVFAINTEIYSVNLRAQSEYRKIRTRKNFASGQFSCS